MNFERFIDLITPVFANKAAEINDFVLRSTFDRLFDQNWNGTIEQKEFDSLLIILKAFNTNKDDIDKKPLLYANLRQTFTNANNQITFKGKKRKVHTKRSKCFSFWFSSHLEFSEFVKCGYVRELLME